MTDTIEPAQELLCDAYWEQLGPLEGAKSTSELVLYALSGRHALSSSNVVLYIGSTIRQAGAGRFAEHVGWARLEAEPIQISAASVARFTDWKTWHADKRRRYPQLADRELVLALEKLLIFVHQPPYNSRELRECPSGPGGTHLRLFNSGHYGSLLPELSTRRYVDLKRPEEPKT